MVHELIRHLIDDERRAGMRRERVEGVLQELPLFCGFEDAERNAGNDIVAVFDAAFGQLGGELRRVLMEHGHPRVATELLLKMLRQFRVEFKKEQARVGVHPVDDLASVATLSGAKFGDHPRSTEVHSAGYLSDQGF